MITQKPASCRQSSDSLTRHFCPFHEPQFVFLFGCVGEASRNRSLLIQKNCAFKVPVRAEHAASDPPLEVDFLFYTLEKHETKSDMKTNTEHSRALAPRKD